jgi:hypothetical protein
MYISWTCKVIGNIFGHCVLSFIKHYLLSFFFKSEAVGGCILRVAEQDVSASYSFVFVLLKPGKHNKYND